MAIGRSGLPDGLCRAPERHFGSALGLALLLGAVPAAKGDDVEEMKQTLGQMEQTIADLEARIAALEAEKKTDAAPVPRATTPSRMVRSWKNAARSPFAM